MRLTLALLKRKSPPGCIWTGKHRLGHHVFPQNIERFVNRLKIEEQNMFLLRHPYLTLDEECGIAPMKQGALLTETRLETASKKLVRSVRFEDKLKHLCVSEGWEN